VFCNPKILGQMGGLSPPPSSLVLPPPNWGAAFWEGVEGAAGTHEDVIKPAGVIKHGGAGWVRRACLGPAGGEVKRGQRQGDTPKAGRAMGEALGWVLAWG